MLKIHFASSIKVERFLFLLSPSHQPGSSWPTDNIFVYRFLCIFLEYIYLNTSKYDTILISAHYWKGNVLHALFCPLTFSPLTKCPGTCSRWYAGSFLIPLYGCIIVYLTDPFWVDIWMCFLLSATTSEVCESSAHVLPPQCPCRTDSQKMDNRVEERVGCFCSLAPRCSPRGCHSPTASVTGLYFPPTAL